jgi:hypothetical protein
MTGSSPRCSSWVAADGFAADAFAANVLPIIRQVEAAGATGYRAIAAALNARRVRRAAASGTPPLSAT